MDQFSELMDKTLELANTYRVLVRDDENIISSNSKTGVSINFPIALTCRPLETCRQYCYAGKKGKPITWATSLKKQVRVWRYFKSTTPDEVAERVLKECHRRKLTWLRWNGCGDLFPEACNVISRVAKADPGITHLVVTKKPEYVPLIPELDNIFLMFSIDWSEESRNRLEEARRHKHKRMYVSQVRHSMDDDTSKASIIFNMQGQKGLEFDDKRRCCPVDAGALALKGGCDKCRKCFTPGALTTATSR